LGKQTKLVIVSDVDGCLIDRDTHSHADADQAVERIAQAGVPLVPCSSRTRVEIERLREELGVADPFIAENGGAIYLPNGAVPFPPAGAVRRGSYDVVELGRPHRQVLQLLIATAARLKLDITTFSDMSVQRVAAECGLSLADARLAKLREHDEPFRLVEPDPDVRAKLRRALRTAGLRCTTGRQYDHVTMATDMGVAVALLRRFYMRTFSNVTVVGLGSGENDLDLLRAVDVPIVVRSPDGSETETLSQHLRKARVTTLDGPAGWSEAVLALLDDNARLPAPGGPFPLRGARGKTRQAS
jgi:mannosyl-3-phosphoglycerate phosphatase